MSPTLRVVCGLLVCVLFCSSQSAYDDPDVQKYLSALEQNPDFWDALIMLAQRVSALGDTAWGIESYERSLFVKPLVWEVLNNLGISYTASGRPDDALRTLRTATRVNPKCVQCYENMADAFLAKGGRSLLAEAVNSMLAGTRADKTNWNIWYRLGTTLNSYAHYKWSAAAYDRAAGLGASGSGFFFNYGECLRAVNRDYEAIDAYLKALEESPHDSLITGALMSARLGICEWDNWEENVAELHASIEAARQGTGTGELMSPPHAHILLPPHLLLAVNARHAVIVQARANYAAGRNGAGLGLVPSLLAPRQRLKIGYVSTFSDPSKIDFLLQDIFRNHDFDKMEVYCYALYAWNLDCDLRKRFLVDCEHFVDVAHVPDHEAAMSINSEGIHVAVDFNLYSAGRSEIFAHRPALVQVNFHDHPTSSGAEYMQFIHTDRLTSTPELSIYYSEKMMYMPNSVVASSHKISGLSILDNIEEYTSVRAQAGLPEDGVVYCVFNQAPKYDPKTFTVWMNILKRVPGSYLWVVKFPAGDIEPNLRKQANARGVDWSRIIFAKWFPFQEHIRMKGACNVMLDSPLWNGHTTLSDVLWGGVPVLTMPLENLATRIGPMICESVGCPELIVREYTDYEDVAVALGRNPARLWQWRGNLWTRRETEPMFQPGLWTEYLQTRERMAWETWAEWHDRPDSSGRVGGHVFGVPTRPWVSER